ncbi:4-hydroxybenzoate polyprenyltransferase, mitochondrial-like [Penaeus vannamei]|uniref:4-hydroxybenzoate polyprenyltransferase, mitochondrial-like n=1 Tax=Penaeus vannamei TaxID=6689 RepID=UPI00387F7E4F
MNESRVLDNVKRNVKRYPLQLLQKRDKTNTNLLNVNKSRYPDTRNNSEYILYNFSINVTNTNLLNLNKSRYPLQFLYKRDKTNSNLLNVNKSRYLDTRNNSKHILYNFSFSVTNANLLNLNKSRYPLQFLYKRDKTNINLLNKRDKTNTNLLNKRDKTNANLLNVNKSRYLDPRNNSKYILYNFSINVTNANLLNLNKSRYPLQLLQKRDKTKTNLLNLNKSRYPLQFLYKRDKTNANLLNLNKSRYPLQFLHQRDKCKLAKRYTHYVGSCLAAVSWADEDLILKRYSPLMTLAVDAADNFE